MNDWFPSDSEYEKSYALPDITSDLDDSTYDPDDVASGSSDETLDESDNSMDGPRIAALLNEVTKDEENAKDEEMAECKTAFEDLLLAFVPGLWRDNEAREFNLAEARKTNAVSKTRTTRHQQRLLQKAEASISDKLTIVVLDWLSGDFQNAFKYSEHNSNSKRSEDCTACQEALRFTTEAASAARAFFDLSVADRQNKALLETQFRSYMRHLEPACLKLDEARIRAHPDQRSTRCSQAEFLAMVRAPEQLHDDVKAPLVATFGSKENSSRCNNEATDEAYPRATLALLAAYQRALDKEAGNTLLVTCIRDSLATLRLEEATSSARHSVVHRPWNLLGDFKWSESDPAEYQQAKGRLMSMIGDATQRKTTEEW